MGLSRSVAFAVSVTGRRSVHPITSASTSAFGWLLASSTGPVSRQALDAYHFHVTVEPPECQSAEPAEDVIRDHRDRCSGERRTAYTAAGEISPSSPARAACCPSATFTRLSINAPITKKRMTERMAFRLLPVVAIVTQKSSGPKMLANFSNTL